jgi:caa(3)-type oxidase subunit IV
MADSAARTYMIIWGWLAGLMLLGVGLSELPIPKFSIVLIVLALSSVKAVLVGLYYMHLKMDRKVLTLVALFPLVLILLAIGLVFSSALVKL